MHSKTFLFEAKQLYEKYNHHAKRRLAPLAITTPDFELIGIYFAMIKHV